MDCSDSLLGGAVLVRISGRIDQSNADRFRDSLSAALGKAKTALVLDLADVEYMSSAGLRSLMIVFKAAKAESKAFAVANLQPLMQEIFAISRFDLVFPIFGSVRDAIQRCDPAALAAFESQARS